MIDKVRNYTKKVSPKSILAFCALGLILFSVTYILAFQDNPTSQGEHKKPFVPVSSNIVSEAAFHASRSELGTLLVGYVFENFSSALPVDVVYETDNVIAFWHPKPYWEKHIVIVPKKRIESISALTSEDAEYLSAVFEAVQHIVKDQKLEAYTVTVNGGTRQDVMQIHFHLWSGGVR